MHIVRELTKITAARFEHLNFDAVGDLLGSEQHLRYYSDELMSKIANRLTNASLREMFIMPEQVTSSPIPTMLNRNVCINLSMLCHMNMYDTAERILDRLQENDIEINETFCCAVLFVICKMKGERYHKLVSRCINQLNAFKRTSLQKGLNNRYRGMLSVSNYIMDKLGLYKDLRLKEQVSGDPFEEDSDSQSYLENTVKALIDSAMHDESVRRYRDDVFEHDLYYPKLNTIVEFLGPNHFL